MATKVLPIRIEPALLDAAKRAAEAEQRSLSSYLRWLISQDMEARKGARKSAGGRKGERK